MQLLDPKTFSEEKMPNVPPPYFFVNYSNRQSTCLHASQVAFGRLQLVSSSVILYFVCTEKFGEGALVGLISFLLPSVHFSEDNCRMNYYIGIVFALSLCGDGREDCVRV